MISSWSGAALAGLILERVYNKSYKDLICGMLAELELNETSIFEYDDSLLRGIGAKGNLCNNWIWKKIVPWLVQGPCFLLCVELWGKILENKHDYIDYATRKHGVFQEKELGMDIGCFWFHFRDYDVYFHNGNTGCFNCAIAIDRKGSAVMAVLSNKRYNDNGFFVVSDIIRARK